VKGFVKIAECDNIHGEVVNIGSGREIAIGVLVRLTARLIGTDIEILQKEKRVRPKQSEVERLLCDNQKITRLVGWVSEVSLEEGLKRTIRWLREYLNLYKPEIYNV
jgi:dTDP-glucose 4,6-dehydratase